MQILFQREESHKLFPHAKASHFGQLCILKHLHLQKEKHYKLAKRSPEAPRLNLYDLHRKTQLNLE